MATKPRGGQHTTPLPGEKRPSAPPAPPMKHQSSTKGCNCAKKVDQALEAQGVRLIRKLTINFTTKATGVTPPLLMVEKFKPSRKAAPSVVCSFCPFCGTQYPK